MNTSGFIRALLAGAAIGGVTSIAPIPLNLLGPALFLGIAMVRLNKRQPGVRGSLWVSGGVAAAMVLGAIWLPVKQLDGKVDPFHYQAMSLDDLCEKLRSDHRVLVRADVAAGTNWMAAFSSDRVMSRREVLEKLAQEAECDLRIRYCGTGATVLWGAHPGFTRLRPRVAPTPSSEGPPPRH